MGLRFFKVVIFIFLSCAPIKFPSFKEVKQELDNRFPTPNLLQSASSTRSRRIEVYLDGSKSMKGFVSQINSEYVNFLQSLHHWLSPRESVEYFKFGEWIRKTSIYSARESIFYEDRYTRLQQLINSFVEVPSSVLPHTILIISDGVQSYGQTSIMDMVRSVLNLVGRDYHFQIIGIVSRFSGLAYSEILRSSIGRYHGRRPFYCFIFSIDPNLGNSLKEYLYNNGINSNLFVLSYNNIFENVSLEYVIESRINRKSNPLRIKTICGKKKEGVYLQFRDEEASLGYLKVILNLTPFSCVSDWSIVGRGARMEVYSLDWKTKNSVSSGCQLISSALSPSSSSKIEYLISFRKPENPAGEAYKIIIYPDERTFLPPDWIEEWSTNSDDNLRFYNRTLFLKHFVERCMYERLRRIPLCIFYVMIK